MSSTVTELFEKLSDKKMTLSKRIVYCPYFKKLRNGVYRIMKILGDVEIDTSATEGLLRREFYKSLRAPVNIENSFTDILIDFCPKENLEESWGADFASLVDSVTKAESALKNHQTTEGRLWGHRQGLSFTDRTLSFTNESTGERSTKNQ